MPGVESRLVLTYIQHHQIGFSQMLLQPGSGNQHPGPHRRRRGCRVVRVDSLPSRTEHGRANQRDCGFCRYGFQHHFSILDWRHSAFSSTTGSSFATRVSGTNDDAIATATSKAEDATKVTESRGPTPKITPDMKLENSHAMPSPAPRPAMMRVRAWRIMEPITLAAVAPMARRTPI